ncbi:plasmid mobilization relaxosome protein MobC, partial [Amycolatopsis rhizosphaerae]|uniref:plasmid mobilization relaxosome protein MobC n=1 Tax=Amycolatopsis rhizosphaerae TaxID=2053003 RepID=UPI001C972186
INLRTTHETYERLCTAAGTAGLTVPRYLIESALRDSPGGWSLRQQRWWVERLDVVETRLTRIGVNLNQMAMVANATGHTPDGLAAALGYLSRVLEELGRVLAAIDPDRSRSEEP